MADRRFENLVRAHHGAVRTFAGSLASSETIADDATQETFLRAWRYLDSFRGDGSFEGWLIRICRHCVYDMEIKEQRARQIVADAANVRPLPVSPQDSTDMMVLLRSLRPEYREILTLCGVLGYDYESAGRVLEVPVGTVRSRLYRARRALTAALAAEDDGQAVPDHR